MWRGEGRFFRRVTANTATSTILSSVKRRRSPHPAARASARSWPSSMDIEAQHAWPARVQALCRLSPRPHWRSSDTKTTGPVLCVRQSQRQAAHVAPTLRLATIIDSDHFSLTDVPADHHHPPPPTRVGSMRIPVLVRRGLANAALAWCVRVAGACLHAAASRRGQEMHARAAVACGC